MPTSSQRFEAAVADTGATSIKDMGKVVGLLKTKYAGQMDFAKASGCREGQARRLTRLSRAPVLPGAPWPISACA